MYPLAFCVVHRWISDATGMRLTGSSYIPSLLARLACNSAVTLYHVSFATCPPSWRNAATPASFSTVQCTVYSGTWLASAHSLASSMHFRIAHSLQLVRQCLRTDVPRTPGSVAVRRHLVTRHRPLVARHHSSPDACANRSQYPGRYPKPRYRSRGTEYTYSYFPLLVPSR